MKTARYHCADCDAAWKDETRWSAISKGRWIADAPFNGTAGFHLNEIYSPWVRLEAMAKAFLSARAGGDETMKTFINTSLGETWMESGEAPDWQRLQGLKEDWNAGTVPAGGLFLTAGVDVQKDRIEVDVWAWGKGLQSWLIDHIVIEGGPGDQACWQKLSDLLGRTWTHASGTPMTIARLAIDTGYETAAVYAWARQVGFAQVAPVKGVAVRVPAEEVLHIYRPIDAGQIRGLPHVAPAMVRLFLLDQYDDAELDRKKKTAAMFAGFITKTAPEDPMMGEGAADLDGASIASLEPGTMQVLLPGEDVRFSSPADVGGG
jgi:phage terminase large subunit GpA-like protein